MFRREPYITFKRDLLTLARLAAALDAEAQRAEDFVERWMEDLGQMGQLCERVGATMVPVGSLLDRQVYLFTRYSHTSIHDGACGQLA